MASNIQHETPKKQRVEKMDELQAVINPRTEGVISGMTKRTAYSNGSHVEIQNPVKGRKH